jgi:hypothetical protein
LLTLEILHFLELYIHDFAMTDRVSRKIFGPRRAEVSGGWSTLHNKELCDLYSSPRMRWAGHVAQMGEKRKLYRLLVGKPEGKRPLGTLRSRWIDNGTCRDRMGC